MGRGANGFYGNTSYKGFRTVPHHVRIPESNTVTGLIFSNNYRSLSQSIPMSFWINSVGRWSGSSFNISWCFFIISHVTSLPVGVVGSVPHLFFCALLKLFRCSSDMVFYTQFRLSFWMNSVGRCQDPLSILCDAFYYFTRNFASCRVVGISPPSPLLHLPDFPAFFGSSYLLISLSLILLRVSSDLVAVFLYSPSSPRYFLALFFRNFFTFMSALIFFRSSGSSYLFSALRSFSCGSLPTFLPCIWFPFFFFRVSTLQIPSEKTTTFSL